MEKREIYYATYQNINKMRNITEDIEIKVLSPLHIGCGKELKYGLDFLVKGNAVSIIDYHNLYDNLLKKSNDATALSNELAKTIISRDNLSSFCENHFSKGDTSIFKKKKYTIQNISVTPETIKCLYCNPLSNLPTIPGSSVKGAIRSIILNLILSQETKDSLRKNNEKIIENQIELTNLTGKNTYTDKNRIKELKRDIRVSMVKMSQYFNSPDIKDLMSCIRISDFTLTSETSAELYNTNIFDLSGQDKKWHGGWKVAQNKTESKRKPRGFNTFYECISPGTIAEGKISLRGDVLDLMVKKGLITRDAINSYIFFERIENLFYTINLHSISYLEKEIDFFTEYETDGTHQIIESLTEIKNQIPTDSTPKACVLKMSAGSGFHSITGDWMYPNHIEPYDAHLHPFSKETKIPYKTRKIVEVNNHLSEMGFVKLTMI